MAGRRQKFSGERAGDNFDEKTNKRTTARSRGTIRLIYSLMELTAENLLKENKKRMQRVTLRLRRIPRRVEKYSSSWRNSGRKKKPSACTTCAPGLKAGYSSAHIRIPRSLKNAGRQALIRAIMCMSLFMICIFLRILYSLRCMIPSDKFMTV